MTESIVKLSATAVVGVAVRRVFNNLFAWIPLSVGYGVVVYALTNEAWVPWSAESITVRVVVAVLSLWFVMALAVGGSAEASDRHASSRDFLRAGGKIVSLFALHLIWAVFLALFVGVLGAIGVGVASLSDPTTSLLERVFETGKYLIQTSYGEWIVLGTVITGFLLSFLATYVWIPFIVAPYEIAMRHAPGAWPAYRMAWRAVRGHRFFVLRLLFLKSLLMLVGAAFFGVGLFVALPVAAVGVGVAYSELRRRSGIVDEPLESVPRMQ